MKKILLCVCVLMLTGCTSGSLAEEPVMTPAATEEAEEEIVEATKDTLYYQGHASVRIDTSDGYVIYVDPYAGDGYEEAADLVLVTHDHFDHTATDLITNRNDDYEEWTYADALVNGVYNVLETPYAKVEAVQAGNNANHSLSSCVGYVITLNSGITIYFSGDTSTTEQMKELAERSIDYAFFCCDGVYNMDVIEASQCADIVNAKHSVPYHTCATDTGSIFSTETSRQFTGVNALIVKNGETITLE